MWVPRNIPKPVRTFVPVRTIVEDEIRSSNPAPKFPKGVQDENKTAARHWKFHGVLAVAKARKDGCHAGNGVAHDGGTSARTEALLRWRGAVAKGR